MNDLTNPPKIDLAPFGTIFVSGKYSHVTFQEPQGTGRCDVYSAAQVLEIIRAKQKEIASLEKSLADLKEQSEKDSSRLASYNIRLQQQFLGHKPHID